MAIEAMGDRNPPSFEIYVFYISRESFHSPEQPTERIYDGVHFEIARCDLVQHRREQKVVVARHQGDVYVTAAAQRSFQFDRGVYATESAPEYKDTAGAIRTSLVLGRTPASVIMILVLIQWTGPRWNRCK
jgi:hypothetical protein